MARRAARRSAQRRGKVPSPFSASSTRLPARSGVPASIATASGNAGSPGATGAPPPPTPRTRWTAVPRVMKSSPTTAATRTIAASDHWTTRLPYRLASSPRPARFDDAAIGGTTACRLDVSAAPGGAQAGGSLAGNVISIASSTAASLAARGGPSRSLVPDAAPPRRPCPAACPSRFSSAIVASLPMEDPGACLP